MSAPPVPDVFGNYALGDFVEVVSPAGISWLPQTAGWEWLGAVLAVLVLRYSWRGLRHWYRNRYRREAIARLQQLEHCAGHDAWLVDLNRLLKLTALAAFSRERVARLSGEEWVDFLDQQCPAPVFSAEQRTLLAVGTYNCAMPANETRSQLLAACRNWVNYHVGPVHV